MTDSSNARFNAEAAAWDNNPDVHRATAGALKAILARFPELEKNVAGGTVGSNGPDILEIGSGTGLLTLQIANYAKSVLAVDAASGMTDALNVKLSADSAPQNVETLSIMLEDPEDARLPAAVKADEAIASGVPSSANGMVANGSGMNSGRNRDAGRRKKFDMILSHLVLHHIPELAPLLTTMIGCLKPSGVVALTDFEDFGPEARAFHPESKMAGVERDGVNAEWFRGLMVEAGFVDVEVKAAWKMDKDVERFPGEWGEKKPSGGGLKTMEFPFLLCVGRKRGA